ncbi:MAG: hypothetical protein IJW46_01865 [Clostridia bacterium]|nr:hypothetical protein [Clostridia bacterium]
MNRVFLSPISKVFAGLGVVNNSGAFFKKLPQKTISIKKAAVVKRSQFLQAFDNGAFLFSMQ